MCLQMSEDDEKSRCKLTQHQIDCPTVGQIDVFVQASTPTHSVVDPRAHQRLKKWPVAEDGLGLGRGWDLVRARSVGAEQISWIHRALYASWLCCRVDAAVSLCVRLSVDRLGRFLSGPVKSLWRAHLSGTPTLSFESIGLDRLDGRTGARRGGVRV